MSNFSNTLTNNMKNINVYSKNKLDLLFSNNIIAPVLGLLLVIYASLAAPKLPPNLAKLFDNMWFKIVFLFLISYSAWKNPLAAILASIGILITIQLLTYNYTSMNTINNMKHNNTNNHQYDLINENPINNLEDNIKYNMYDSNDDKHNEVDDVHDNTNAPRCNIPNYDVNYDSCNVVGYSDPTYASY